MQSKTTSITTIKQEVRLQEWSASMLKNVFIETDDISIEYADNVV